MKLQSFKRPRARPLISSAVASFLCFGQVLPGVQESLGRFRLQTSDLET